MTWHLHLFALFAGAANTALGGSNATLSKTLAQPITAGLIVQVVTIVAMVAVELVHGGMRWPGAGRFDAPPWWAWLGGLGAATILLAQLLVAQKVGAAPCFALTVTAGMLTSVLLDQFGWLGFDRKPARLSRWIGVGSIVAGVVLFARNWSRHGLAAVICEREVAGSVSFEAKVRTTAGTDIEGLPASSARSATRA